VSGCDRLSKPRHRALPLLAALLLCACGKEDPRPVDPEELDPNPDGLPQCQVDQRAVGLDEATPIGATASELFRWIAGPHTESLLWLSPDGTGDSYARLEGFGPEQGSSQLQLEFEPVGARVFTRVPLDEASANRCAPSLGLDVNLHLSTAGGALDERVQATLEAPRPDYAQLQPLYLPLDTLQGSFDPQISVKPGFDFSQSPLVWLSLTLSEAGATGQLMLVTLVSNGRGELGSIPTIATFPDGGERCEAGRYLVSADHSVDGVSRDAVLQQLNGASPALLDDGATTMELEYTGVGERACVEAGVGVPTTLSFPATVRLRSSDGRVDGSISTTLQGEANSGALHSRAASLDVLRDPALAAAAVPSYGLQDAIDFSSFNGGSFEFQADVSATSDSGSLIVSGWNDPQCSSLSIAGAYCTRVSVTELWAARWSQR
jgi:hypothetical protein